MSNEIKSRIAPLLQKKAEHQRMDIADVARAINTTYEYARRLLYGYSIPSKAKLGEITQAMGFSDAEGKRLEKLVYEDRQMHDKRRISAREQ